MMTIQNATSLLELGMFREAWDAVQALPEDLREAAAARRIRARSAALLGRWEVAETVANELRHGNLADREEAAWCFQSIAAEHFKHGREDQATRCLKKSVGAWPEQMASILEDPRFSEKFVSQFERSRRGESIVSESN